MGNNIATAITAVAAVATVKARGRTFGYGVGKLLQGIANTHDGEEESGGEDEFLHALRVDKEKRLRLDLQKMF
jgi:hypothetical protein